MQNPPDPGYAHLAVSFGQKVEAARAARGLTQDELVARSHLSRTHVQNILYARYYREGDEEPSYPKLDTIFKLTIALELPPDYLGNWSRPVEPVPPPTRPEA